MIRRTAGIRGARDAVQNREGVQPSGRWTSLDGVRGLAAAAVVAFHAGYLPGGFGGVDVFFVLSGFLITGLLLHEHDNTGGIALPRFYRRRLLRLYPALVVVIAFTMIVAVGSHHPAGKVVAAGVAALLYAGNWHMYSGLLLQHVWTLALEEQFYVVWPVFILLTLRIPKLRWLAAPAAGLWIALIVIPWHGFVGTVIDTTYLRASGLPFGCAIAIAYRRGVTVPPWLTALCGAVLIVFMVRMPSGGALSRFGLAAVVATPFILGMAANPPQRMNAVLSSRPLVWLGQRSYALYLWHFPIFSLAIEHLHEPRPVRVVIATFASLVAAAASWQFVERPFLKLRDRMDDPGLRPSTASIAP